MRRRLLISCGLSALALTGAAAAPATLTLGTSGTPIPPLAISGFNFSWQMPLVEAIDAVKSVAPTSLRYPGGNVGDENDLARQGLEYFKSSLAVTGKGTAGIVQTRVFATRTDARNKPEDAAQAAREARDIGLNVAYWEIGNEPDLYATNRGDPSWTPEKYCQTFRAQREAILKVDPSARFAGPAVSKGAGPAMTYLQGFVKSCGDVVDLLTWHEYPTDGTATDEAALATAAEVTGHVQAVRDLWSDPARNPLGHARQVELGVTEFSLSWKSGRARHLADQVNALWTAETSLRLAEAGVQLSSYFAIIAAGSHGLVDRAGVPRPTLYAFQQLRHFRGTALPVQSSDAALWAHAAQEGALLTLLVTNTATAPRTLATTLPGLTLIGAKTFTEKTVQDEADLIRQRLGPAVDLPGRSMTRLVYKRLP
ncbi:GH39 family glycosyl hydrolase [Deinococcus hopiensis]|uniref:Glycosyl hydrolases family 39 n=1 Tax=Deinococcus hopiensis KR-140 TaxID=695939 RepID=A0A1W1UGX4_9DEIO|nr:hypothetical protein [Deinococcus hopiensis]SMB80293.1 Glycosyl hydrolases family 39 [Deinococcus hopiensis KR-140]